RSCPALCCWSWCSARPAPWPAFTTARYAGNASSSCARSGPSSPSGCTSRARPISSPSAFAAMTASPWPAASVVMPHWRERPEGGNRLALAIIRWLILHVGRGVAQVCLWPTTLYFFLVRGPERRASRDWLKRVNAPRQGHAGVLIHIYTFAVTIVDRVLLLAGRGVRLDVRAEGTEALHELLRKGRGCMLLGSHLGSFEAVRVFSRQAPAEHRRLKVVMDRAQNSLITRMLEEISPDIRDTVIDAGQPGPAIVLQAGGVMEAGGGVAVLADRTRAGDGAGPVCARCEAVRR